ncbi:ATP-grasp domain-containing protein [Microbacterium hydrocarbonoxydans]|uniref:ATP-grasp domain-containing protein n=1 Tax=Microbacterium hydrocarbonoxydans TaxID=273678 RepID=UPI0013DADDC2|nr:ATP-grasp domain-containing protein [Microbacterium hydrocarbonoxydans]
MRALVLGGRSPVALEIVRNLGRHGHEVHVAESVAVNPAGWSRHASGSIRIRSPRFHFRAFLLDLAAAVERHGIDLLIPTCEETFFVARGAEWLRQRCPGLRVVSGPFDDIAALHDKHRAMGILGRLGVPVPETELIRGPEELDALLRRDRSRPLVLKRRFSRFGVQVRLLPPGARRVQPEIEFDRDEHHARIAPDLAGDWVAQEHVDGRLHCAYAYAHEGRLLACVQYADARAASFKVLTSFRPVHDPRFQEAIERTVAGLRFSGHISLDAIIGEDRIAVIECNPRVTSGIHCLPDADLGALFTTGNPADASAAPAPPVPPVPVPAQIRMMNLLRRGGHDKDVRDVVHAADDRMPSLAYALLLGGFALSALRHRIPLAAATTRDIEWNGQELPAL